MPKLLREVDCHALYVPQFIVPHSDYICLRLRNNVTYLLTYLLKSRTTSWRSILQTDTHAHSNAAAWDSLRMMMMMMMIDDVMFLSGFKSLSVSRTMAMAMAMGYGWTGRVSPPAFLHNKAMSPQRHPVLRETLISTASWWLVGQCLATGWWGDVSFCP